ncbi:MAG: tRNA (adenosine(37)-N6)-threonylcarbamoyltransferase complex transferase subunit TsaD [Pseudomonadota bacterium]
MSKSITVLGLESSCDDTAAAVLRVEHDEGQILSSVVHDQTDLHARYGGVVPEIAARAHAEKLDVVAKLALHQASTELAALDLIAVTAGPGLIGGVLSGVMFAKGLAAAQDIPMVGVNHLAGHALTPGLSHGLAAPYLMLLVSGGHCQFLIVHRADHFTRLGGTIDDAPGEAFDKVARLLGLPQPGGPAVEQAAQSGLSNRFSLPRPLLDRPGCDMSFSGLKTALLRQRDRLVADQGGLYIQDRNDLCRSFQDAVVDVLTEKTRRALSLAEQKLGYVPAFSVAGGVAANTQIRRALEGIAQNHVIPFVAPPLHLCTDNAAMIAYAGALLNASGHSDDMRLMARPRWPLDTASPTMLGGGRKGAKA